MTDFFLETPRLILRPHQLQDAEYLYELNSDPEITLYTPDGPLPDLQAARKIAEYLKKQYEQTKMGRWVVLSKKDQLPLGWCGLKWLEDKKAVDIGYRFFKKAWGHGFAFEAAQACMNYGFQEMQLPRIIAEAQPGNRASLRVIEKLGMQLCGQDEEAGAIYLVYEKLNPKAIIS